MTRHKAELLASALMGQVETDTTDRTHAVGVTIADGRYVLIGEDAGARYFDRVACWEGYMVHGSDPKGDIHAEEWIQWDGSRRWAFGLASLLGAEAHHTGGNIWWVRYARPDGRRVVIAETGAAVYADLDAEVSDCDGELFSWFEEA